MKTIALEDTDLGFRTLIERVRMGERFTVVDGDHAVAIIAPADPEADRKREARRQLFERLSAQPALGYGKFDRDELYED
jgi:antitoxin (DNA-binding transcriptional repressor) of toxin-antitoxin stability system